jgi:hypothetical protein
MSKLQRVLLAVLLVIMLFGSIPLGRAHAWSYAKLSSRPGAVIVPTVYISDLPAGNNILSLTLTNSSVSTGPVVYRSPATTGDQIILAAYGVEMWNGAGWVPFAYSPMGVLRLTIRANQSSVVFPNLYIQPPVMPAGYYRVTWSFVWGTTTGAALGSTNVVSNLTTDHVCGSTNRWCRAYVGYFQLR